MLEFNIFYGVLSAGVPVSNSLPFCIEFVAGLSAGSPVTESLSTESSFGLNLAPFVLSVVDEPRAVPFLVLSSFLVLSKFLSLPSVCNFGGSSTFNVVLYPYKFLFSLGR